ncbi:hypothetical protein EAG_06305 [Camponotus floridanus]|uniref:Uncharacterized protein n=1 Tax=Camponotus floridanus TaxID=104421 RepID=E2AHK4_CAMFO|nr:hypothetical protein EAG_06305 [Camponotus floridanus]
MLSAYETIAKTNVREEEERGRRRRRKTAMKREKEEHLLRELSTYVALCYLPSDHRAKFRRAGYEIASLPRARVITKNQARRPKSHQRRCVSAILARRPLTRGRAGTNMKPSAMHGDASSEGNEEMKKTKRRKEEGKDDTVASSTR